MGDDLEWLLDWRIWISGLLFWAAVRSVKWSIEHWRRRGLDKRNREWIERAWCEQRKLRDDDRRLRREIERIDEHRWGRGRFD